MDSGLDLLIYSFFNMEVLQQALPYLWKGLQMTLLLTVIAVPLGILAGLLVATVYSFGRRAVNIPLVLYVDFFRSIPPIVLLIVVYYGSPMLGADLPVLAAVALAFTLNTSAYYGEIFRAGIESIPRGQMEAARSTGLTRLQAMVFVIIPQAARNVLPDLVSNTVEVVKFTSIASVVALPELLRMARVVQGLTFNPTPLVAAAVIYLLLLWPVVRLMSRLEHGLVKRH
jgi:polar amino acid transport system permease protein